jgi:hypothetical protein
MTAKTHEEIEALVQQLADVQTRAVARRQLREYGPAVADRLVAILENSDLPLNMRWAAITLLEEWQYEPAVPTLLAVLKSEQNLIGEAARALRGIAGKDIGESVEQWELALSGEEGVPATSPLDDVSSPEDQVGMIQEAVGDTADEIAWDDAGAVYVLMPVGDRKHQLLISFEGTGGKGRRSVFLYTESGPPPDPDTARQMLDMLNVTLKYGRFALRTDDGGEARVVMEHRIHDVEFASELLAEVIRYMAREADQLEERLTGSDEV